MTASLNVMRLGAAVTAAVTAAATALGCKSQDAPQRAPELVAAPAAAVPVDPRSCGALECRLYDSPAEAFAAVMQSDPRVLAVGEAHAQRGAPNVPTATERFAVQLLPSLQGRASDLIVELWGPAQGCNKAVARVAEQQKAVTKSQEATNPGEYARLAASARKLNITPHRLEPSCDEYEKISRAGDSDIDLMLTLVANLTGQDAKRLLASEKDDPNKSLVVAFGGAMHNDLSPRPGSEDWSFGPDLSKHTQGRYVALDLIVPEYIADTPPWRALPWVAHFDPAAHPDKTTLFKPEPGSFVMIFPRHESKASLQPPP